MHLLKKRFISLNFHVVETSTTLWLAKEIIEDYWDKANYWNTSLGKPWQRQEPSISSNLQPSHWHMTWLSTPNRQQLVVATMLHTIKHCYWAEGCQREALWRLFKYMLKSHFIWSSHEADLSPLPWRVPLEPAPENHGSVHPSTAPVNRQNSRAWLKAYQLSSFTSHNSLASDIHFINV